jgi:HD-GYP domain-containing protein (c-di-GMP phosphodiesterase class II)
MYVARLDLSWFRSPFLRHSFLIERTSQIERLARAGVKTVEVDSSRGIDTGPPDETGVPPPTQAAEAADSQVRPSKRIKPMAQLNEEHARALQAKQQLDESVHSIFSSIARTGTVHPEQAAEAVQEITIVARTLPHSALFMALSQQRAGDASLSRHALTTCTLALVLGQSMQFNPLELHELATAALLHDIGLLQVSPGLIRRAHAASSPLSYLEQRQFRTHPRLSVVALEQQGGFESPVLHLVGHHHPTYADGTPTQVIKRSLCDRSAILTLVDHYDERLSGFGGSATFIPSLAIQRLYLDADQHGFDRDILTQFIKIVGIYPVYSYVKLNTAEVAMVTGLNEETLHQPIVTITHDAHGVECREPLVIDLAHQDTHEPPRSIERVLDRPPLSETFRTPHAA